MTLNFRFEDVLHALEMKAPALRRWLQFDLIGNTAKGKGREGWALEFTPFDLAVLALLKPMTEFGVPVAAAHKLAVREMREHAGPWSGNEPAESFWTAWAPDTQILISRAEGENGKPAWRVALFEQAETAFTSSAHLTLYPRALIRAAIERAVDAVEIREEKRSA
jgi:hypothetical protein